MSEKVITFQNEEELKSYILKEAKRFLSECTPEMIKEAAKSILNEMPSYNTAMKARNNAIKAASDNLPSVFGNVNPDLATKKLHQANRFDNYGLEKLQSMIGTKVQAIVYVGGDYSSTANFYTGKITNVKRISTNEYQITFQGVNDYDNGDVFSDSFIINMATIMNNYNSLEGTLQNGDKIKINLSNKAARKNVSTLMNRNGSDEYMKPIR